MKRKIVNVAILGLLISAGTQVISAPGHGSGDNTTTMRQAGHTMGRGMGGPGMMGQPGHMMGRGMGGPGMMGQPGNMMGRGMGGPGMMGSEQAQGSGGIRNAPTVPGFEPGMMSNMTPEQRQRHWEQMHKQGYGPGAIQAPDGN